MIKRLLTREDGQVLVMTLLSTALLLGMLGLAVDVGTLFRAKRNLQIAADAAAIAGALEYNYNGSANVSSVAKTAGNNNGVPKSDIAVNISPTEGWHLGSGYVEVIVTESNSTFFFGAFNGINSVNVQARAVAGVTPSPACIYVLNPTTTNALKMQGNSTISAPNCGIVVDSNNAAAMCVQGNSNTINAPYVWVTGSQSSAGQCSKKPSGTTVTGGVLAQNDPFGDQLGPNPSKQCTGSNTVSASNVTSSTTIPFTSVTDSNGKTSEVTCFSSSNVTLSGVTLGSSPSTNGQIFVFENGVQLNGTVTVNGTMDIYSGTFNQNNATLNVYAPGYDNNSTAKTLTYNGIGIMQPASDTNGTCQTGQTGTPCLQVQFGSSYGNLNGYIYAPDSQVFLQDNGGGTVVTGVIADTLYNKSSTLSVTDSYNHSHPSTTPLATVQMVE